MLRRFRSILAKDPSTLLHGHRMDRNRRISPKQDEMYFLIMEMEKFALNSKILTGSFYSVKI